MLILILILICYYLDILSYVSNISYAFTEYEYIRTSISSLMLLSAVRFWRHIVMLRESNNKEHQEYNNDG